MKKNIKGVHIFVKSAMPGPLDESRWMSLASSRLACLGVYPRGGSSSFVSPALFDIVVFH